jgi:hypothetical protein
MSNYPPNWQNAPGQQPAQGMSSGTKVLLGLGIGCLVVVVLCAGAIGVGAWYFQSWAKNAMSNDPAVVASNAAKIAQIDMLPDVKPKGSFDMSIAQMLMVVYADDTQQNSVVMMQFGPMYAGQNRDQLKQQLDASARQQGVNTGQAVGTSETKTVSIPVRGVETPFQITTVKDGQGKAVQLHASGAFSSAGGTTFIQVTVDPAKHNEEAALKMLRSIK